MTLSSSGAYVWIAGGAGATYDSDALYVAQYTSTGTRQWVQFYPSPFGGHTAAAAVASDSSNSVYVTGSQHDASGCCKQRDLVAIKYDVGGNVSWTNQLFNVAPPCGNNDPSSSAGDYIGVDANGLVYVSGGYWGGGGCGNALGLVIYNASSGGTVCTDRYFTGANNQQPRGLVAIPSGGAIVTAASQPFFNGQYNIVTIKYDGGCGHSWLRSIDLGGDEVSEAEISDNAGGVYIAGQTGGGMYVVRYDGSGNVLWSATNPFLSVGANWSRLAADASGVYVTGHSPSPPPNGVWATVAYSPAGALRWTVITPGDPLVGADLPLSVGIDGTGAIYVTTFDASVGYLSKYSNAVADNDGVSGTFGATVPPAPAWIRDGAGPEGASTGPDSTDPNDDNDGCTDVQENGLMPMLGGQRDPLSPWDFFDVPAPALLPTNMTGVRNKIITLSDVLADLAYVGTSAANPNAPNVNGAKYGSDLNGNGILDGVEYDRTPSTTPGQPWRSGSPNGTVTLGDVLTVLAQVGTNCN